MSCYASFTTIYTSNTFDIGYREPEIRIFAHKINKKADFSPAVFLNPPHPPPCELSIPSNVILLLTCAIGVSETSLFRFFGHKISQKGEFPSF